MHFQTQDLPPPPCNCKLYSILEEFHIKKIVKNINARTAVHMSDVAHGSLELFVLQFENIENKYCQLL